MEDFITNVKPGFFLDSKVWTYFWKVTAEIKNTSTNLTFSDYWCRVCAESGILRSKFLHSWRIQTVKTCPATSKVSDRSQGTHQRPTEPRASPTLTGNNRTNPPSTSTYTPTGRPQIQRMQRSFENKNSWEALQTGGILASSHHHLRKSCYTAAEVSGGGYIRLSWTHHFGREH